MDKMKKLELLLMASVAVSAVGSASCFYTTEGNSNLPISGFDRRAENVKELDSDIMFDVIAQIMENKMKEKVRLHLLKRLQSGKILVLKSSKTSCCLVFEEKYCVFFEEGKTLNRKILQKAKFFSIDAYSFEEIKRSICDPEYSSSVQKTMRRVKHLTWNGSKWALTNVGPVMLKCTWDLLKIATKAGANLVTTNPKTILALVGGSFIFPKICDWFGNISRIVSSEQK